MRIRAPAFQPTDFEQLREMEKSLREIADRYFDIEFWQPLLQALEYGRGLDEFKLGLSLQSPFNGTSTEYW